LGGSNSEGSGVARFGFSALDDRARPGRVDVEGPPVRFVILESKVAAQCTGRLAGRPVLDRNRGEGIDPATRITLPAVNAIHAEHGHTWATIRRFTTVALWGLGCPGRLFVQ
jgi:hypothetical protein